jgi:hypothetical protein
MFCKAKVSFRMRILHGRYCSAAHKEAYLEAMDRLGLARLAEAGAFTGNADELCNHSREDKTNAAISA